MAGFLRCGSLERDGGGGVGVELQLEHSRHFGYMDARVWGGTSTRTGILLTISPERLGFFERKDNSCFSESPGPSTH